MNKLQKTIYQLAIPMIFIIPLWLALGRGLFDIWGWWSAIFLVLSPLICVGLLVMWLLIPKPRDENGTKILGKTDATILAALYGAALLAGLFIADAGDVGPTKSIASFVVGEWFVAASSIIGWVLLEAAVVLWIVLIVRAVIERMYNHKRR